MSLPNYAPFPGDVLICDFDLGGFTPPEMVKKRPVVVVSCRHSHTRRLCTVVPISTTEPTPKHAWHHCMPHLVVMGWTANAPMWAKGDMVATVAYDRLNKPYKKTSVGRQYITLRLDEADLEAVRAGLRAYMEL